MLCLHEAACARRPATIDRAARPAAHRPSDARGRPAGSGRRAPTDPDLGRFGHMRGGVVMEADSLLRLLWLCIFTRKVKKHHIKYFDTYMEY